MTALPAFTEQDIRSAVTRLAAIAPGQGWVVSCYLKLEPRDRTRGKYLIKMKNRIKQAVTELNRKPLSHDEREQIHADLRRLSQYLEDPEHLTRSRGVAVFLSQGLGLFEVLPLPHVHRSRLGVSHEPLVRELVALDEEFGAILVVVHDRTSARFFLVTAYDAEELPALPALDATRAGKFHGRGGTPSGSAGEHNYHQRIRTEKQRFYAQVADRVFQLNRERSLSGLVFGGMGVDAGAIVPHLHSYVHDLVLGIVKLTPKKASVAEVREAALALREQRERDWERAHAEAVKNGTPRGWAVNGVAPTLKVLGRGQVRTLLADGHDPDPRIDEAIEDALRQHAQVDVLYDDKARKTIDVLAALLRFRA